MADVPRSPSLLKQQRTPSNSGVPRSTKKKTPQSKWDEAQKVDEAKESIQEDNESQAEDSNLEAATNDGQEEEGTEADDEEGTEVIPAGTVSDGVVLDKDGNTIGRVKGEASELEGSMVDAEGDILDEEGNVIGTAELTKGSALGAEKPDLTAPFGVQDNGEITNATGGVVGKLSEGKPQDLVGTAITSIDADGVMKAETGTTLGKADLKPDLLDDNASDAELSEKADSAIDVKDNEATKADIPEEGKSQKPLSNLGSKAAPSKIGSKGTAPVKAPKDVEAAGGVEAPEGAEAPEGVAASKDIDAPENVEVPEASENAEGAEGLEVKAATSEVEDGSEAVKDLGPKDSASQVAKGAKDVAPGEVDSDSQVAEDAKDLGPKDSASQVAEGAKDVVPGGMDSDSKVTEGTKDLGPKDSASKVAEGAKDSVPGEVDSASKVAEVTKDLDHEDSASQVAEGAKDAVPREVESPAPADADAVKDLGPEETDSQAPGVVDAEKDLDSKDAPEAEVGQEPEQLNELDPKPVDAAEVEQETAEPAVEEAEIDPETPELPDLSILKDKKVNKLGKIVDEKGNPFGQLVSGDPKKLFGKKVDAEGQIWDDRGKIIGRAELLPEEERQVEESAPFEDFPDSVLDKDGNVIFEGRIVGKLIEGDAKKLEGKKIDADGDVLDKNGNTLGKAERYQEEDVVPEEEVPEAPVDLSLLEGKKVNKAGYVVDYNGKLFGKVVSGEVAKLIGKKVDAEGQIWDDRGKVIGKAELLPENERQEEESAPFEDFPDSVLDKDGNVIFEGRIVGKLIEGDAKKLEGKKIDADGDVLDKNGNTLGKAERYQEADIEEEVPEAPVDLSLLEGKKVNKAGYVVDYNGKLFGKVVTGEVAKMVGKKVDKEGKIWSESGKVIGTAELLSVDDRDELSSSPFEDFPDALVEKTGKVVYEGVVVGRLIEGDAKKLAGKKVDADGDVVDRIGNVLGKAERWTEEEVPEPEPEKVDLSALAGMKVNKAGNLVDSHGTIYGRVVPGSDIQKLIGKLSDKNGQIWDASGNVVGQAELVPESERAGLKEGPFTGFDSPTINKDGKVADSKGAIIGRLIEGDVKKLYGKKVDADGDVIDSNGNSIGKAERWEEEVKEKAHSLVEGRKVNREGNVVDENGDLIAKLTDGEITKCAGKEIDADGDVYNSKNQVIGHVTLLSEIPAEPEPEPESEPEPEPVVEEPKETQEEIEARQKKQKEEEQLEADRKLAGRMSFTVQETIDKLNPLLKNIMDEIEFVERQKEEERDEQKLVDKVKPMIEEGGRVLTETNGVIRGMDPDGRITANAKQKAATREATPEEHHLAEVLKELTGNVTQTIEKAKKKIAGMPHAKKELNPLWGLLAEPLGQILAAVGLLLSGVLGLVGRLLQGLGLGGLLDNLLGGLGIKGILKGLGLGTLTSALTGRK